MSTHQWTDNVLDGRYEVAKRDKRWFVLDHELTMPDGTPRRRGLYVGFRTIAEAKAWCEDEADEVGWTPTGSSVPSDPTRGD